jgi:hypothetical protein
MIKETKYRIRLLGLLIFCCCCFKVDFLTAQQAQRYFGTIYNENEVVVELWLVKPKVSCGEGGKPWKYKIKTRNLQLADNDKSFINWKLKTINCSNYLIERNFSILINSITDFRYDGMKGNTDWEFEADSIVGGIEAGGLFYSQNDNLDKNLGPILNLLPPDSIFGAREVIEGQTLRLNITDKVGNASTKWVWYENGCGSGLSVNAGNEYSFKPAKSTILYVRAENGDNFSTCKVVEIKVRDKSIPAEDINILGGSSKICIGEQRRLIIKGGKLGYEAKWVWYNTAINEDSKIGVGDEISISPSATTTYLVQAEGVTGNSEPRKVVISVEKPPKPPLEFTSSFRGDPCANDSGTLSIKMSADVNQQEYIWKFKPLIGELKVLAINSESSLEVIALESGTYSVAGYSKVCGESASLSKSIKVQPRSFYPRPNEVSAKRIKETAKVILRNEGGFLSQNALWRWSEIGQNNTRDVLGFGDSIIIKRKQSTRVILESIGGCKPNLNEPIVIDIPEVKREGLTYDVMSIGLISSSAQLQKKLPNIFVSLTGRKFYYKYSIPFLDGYEYETDNTRVLNFGNSSSLGYKYNGQTLSNIQMAVGGLVLGKRISRFYIGAGYAERTLLQGFDIINLSQNRIEEKAWGVNLEQSFSGVCFDTGLLFKLGTLSLTGGFNLLYSARRDIGYISGQLGIGFNY